MTTTTLTYRPAPSAARRATMPRRCSWRSAHTAPRCSASSSTHASAIYLRRATTRTSRCASARGRRTKTAWPRSRESANSSFAAAEVQQHLAGHARIALGQVERASDVAEVHLVGDDAARDRPGRAGSSRSPSGTSRSSGATHRASVPSSSAPAAGSPMACSRSRARRCALPAPRCAPLPPGSTDGTRRRRSASARRRRRAWRAPPRRGSRDVLIISSSAAPQARASARRSSKWSVMKARTP